MIPKFPEARGAGCGVIERGPPARGPSWPRRTRRTRRMDGGPRRPGLLGARARRAVGVQRGDRLGGGLIDLVLERHAGGLGGHEAGDTLQDVGEPLDRLRVPRGQEVQAALRAVVNGGGSRRRLVERLLSLGLRAGQGALRLLPRLGRGALRLGAGGGERFFRLSARGGDRPFGLFLGRRQHALGLLAGLGAGLLRLRLGLVALPGYLFVGLGLLGPGLVVGQFEDLGDALTDFLVRGLGPERLLAGRGQVTLQILPVVQGLGKSLL